MTDKLKTLRSVTDDCSPGLLTADECSGLPGRGAGIFVPHLFFCFCLLAEKCVRDGLAHIFLFLPAGRRKKYGINPFE